MQIIQSLKLKIKICARPIRTKITFVKLDSYCKCKVTQCNLINILTVHETQVVLQEILNRNRFVVQSWVVNSSTNFKLNTSMLFFSHLTRNLGKL